MSTCFTLFPCNPDAGCPPSFTFSSSSNADSGTLSTKHPSSPKSARPASPAAMLVFPIDPSKHDDKGPLLPAGTTPLVIPGAPSDVLGLIQLPPLKLPAPGCPRNARKGATSAGARMPVQQHSQHPQHQQHQQQAQQRDIPNMPPPPAVAPASCPGSALPGAAPSCPPPAPSACGPPAVPAPTLAATRGTPAPAAAAAAPVLGLQALTISAPPPSAAAAAGAAAAPSPSAATPAPISAAFPPPIAAPSPSAAAAAAKTSAAFPPPIAAPSPSAAAAAAAAAAAPVGAPKTSMPPPSPRRGHPPPSSPPSRFQPLPPHTLSSADGRPQPPLTLEASRTHPDFPLVPLSPSGLHTPSPSAHARAKQLQQQQQQPWQSSPRAAAMHHNTSSSHQPHTHMSHHHHPQPHLYLVNPGSCPSWASTPASSCKGTPLGSRAPHALFNTQLRVALASYSLPPPHLSAPSLDYTTSPPLVGFEHAAVPQCASSPRLSPPQPHSYGNHCQDQQQQQQQLHLKYQQQQPLSPRCDPSMGGLSGNVAFEGEGNAARGTCRSRGATAELSTAAAGTVGSVGADACKVHPHFASGAPPLVQQNHCQSSRGSSRSAAGWPMLQGSASTPGVQQHQQQWQQQDSSNDGSCTATACPATPPHFCVDETTHSSITRSPPDTLNDQQNRHQRVRENSRRGGCQQERCATAGGVRENSRGGGQEGLLPLPQLRLPEQAPQPAASPFCLVPPSSTAAMPLAPPPPTPLPLQPPLLSTAPTPAAANAGQLPCSPNSHSVLSGQQLQHSRSGVAPNETMHMFDPASLPGSDCAAAAATPANLSVHPLLPHSAYPTSITSGTSWHLPNQHQTSAQGPASIHEAPGTEAEPDLLTGPAVWCLPSRHGSLKVASHSPAATTAAAVAAATSSSIIGSHSLATVSPNAGPVQLAKALGASLVRAAAEAAQRMRVVATNVGRGFVLGFKLGLVGECGAPGFPVPGAGNKSHGVVPGGGVGGLVEVHGGVRGECGSPSSPVPGAGNESRGGVQQLQHLLQSGAASTLTQQQQQQLLLCDEDVAELVRAVHVLLEAPQQRWSRGRAAQFAAAKLALRS
ncbi:hypothetical protein DUNSADRAFT_13173 [Dunaliella salina]|uniref:Uncharacterized protein n=1 Tax=Dunaliella salina TaxID=3046 RepID=A0ABQ7G9Y6_DUNSA|nr:hypothetical protein DUNSADRAFT_13173 [Dunaliella salina]|eukprot:KAF5831412.1 hypothetical protein DUNSADRAFT_13173 [Dunaliella salina]